MGKSWKLLAHLREQQSYCNAAFMTFQSIKLERGFCSGDLSFKLALRVFNRSLSLLVPDPEGSQEGEGGRGQLGLALAPLAGSSRSPASRVPQAPAPGGSSACSAGARLRDRGWGAGRPSAPSFGCSQQADDTALPHEEPHKV